MNEHAFEKTHYEVGGKRNESYMVKVNTLFV